MDDVLLDRAEKIASMRCRMHGNSVYAGLTQVVKTLSSSSNQDWMELSAAPAATTQPLTQSRGTSLGRAGRKACPNKAFKSSRS